MRENDFLFQHCHFLHDKFLVNDESLQIHECWHGHVEKSEIDCDFYIMSKVQSRAINDHKKPFLDKWEHVE